MKKMYSIQLMLIFFSISFVPAAQGVSSEETKDVISLDQSSIDCNLDIATLNIDSNFVFEKSITSYSEIIICDSGYFSITKVNYKKGKPLIRYNKLESPNKLTKLDSIRNLNKSLIQTFYFPDSYNLTRKDNYKSLLNIKYNKCLDCHFRNYLLSSKTSDSTSYFLPLFI